MVRDPRVNHSDNGKFIDMVEEYFEKVGEAYYAGQELKDCRPDLSYQTGVTPASTERARDHAKVVEGLDAGNMPFNLLVAETLVSMHLTSRDAENLRAAAL